MIALLFACLLGAVAGSATACLASRYLRGLSLLHPPRSRCDLCGGFIAWHDNIPLLSFFLLGGRCRLCREPIPLYVPGAEIAGALICGLLAWRFAWSATGLLLMLFFLPALALSLIDAASLHLPDSLLAAAALPVLALLLTGGLAPWPQPLYAALAGGGILLVLRAVFQWVRHKEGLGLGDVKLMALLGFLTDVPGVLDILFLAAVLGLAVAGGMRLTRGRAPELLPFGPFLCLAAFLKVLWGNHALLAG